MNRLILVLMFGFIFTFSVGVLAAPQVIDIPRDYVSDQCGAIEDPWHYSQSDMEQGVKVTTGFRSNVEQMRIWVNSLDELLDEAIAKILRGSPEQKFPPVDSWIPAIPMMPRYHLGSSHEKHQAMDVPKFHTGGRVGLDFFSWVAVYMTARDFILPACPCSRYVPLNIKPDFNIQNMDGMELQPKVDIAF